MIQRTCRIGAFMALAFVFSGLTWAAAEILPIDQVRPGMVGVGRTVFEGTRIEEFRVEIIGVLENVGPKQSIILARLTGGPLEKAGVIAGMSGSPVFIDGKLLGAVAYGFPFSKETIAGITPIGEMIGATQTDAPRSASLRFGAGLPAAGLTRPLDRAALVAALRRPLDQIRMGEATLRGGMLNPMAGRTLTPLALPLVFSGFEPGAVDWAREVFASAGFAPVAGSGGATPRALPPLAPGAPLAISLVEGDLDISVTGTITHIDGDHVYAFGHPFYNLGPTQFPMRKAYVYSVFPSLYQSWKITAAGEAVGTVEQDRNTAVAGHLGKTPSMIPVEVTLHTSRGQQRSFSFRVVEDDLLSPVLAYVTLVSVLQGSERAFGTSSMLVAAHLTLSGDREVHVEDMFTEEQPAIQAAALVAAPVGYLMNNGFEHVTVKKLDVQITSFETTQSATLERAWIERNGPVQPGTTIPLRLLLRGYRGDTRTETIPVTIPATAPAGAYSLLVADGAALTAIEQREMQQPFVPRDLDQLVRAINSLRRGNHLYARLLRSEPGVIVGGEYLQSLPPSVLSVLGAPSDGQTVVPLRTASVWDFDLPTNFAISGSRQLAITVER